ncbi:hypothetical protein EJ110_NYTH11588 [Nymphaea thermarum]|nr:hypothetical protein EJ110_NYTH11588 [Nymphaea thermarum]
MTDKMACRLTISVLLMTTAILVMSDSTLATSESREAAEDLRHESSRIVGMKVVIVRPQDGGVPFSREYAQMRDKAAKVGDDPWLSSKRPYAPPPSPPSNPSQSPSPRPLPPSHPYNPSPSPHPHRGLKPPPPPFQDGVHL